MQVAREWKRIEKSATVADFGFKDMLKFLSESRKPKKSVIRYTESTDVTDVEWAQTEPSQKLQLSYTNKENLKERDRVIVSIETIL